jgi:TolA-binding protein
MYKLLLLLITAFCFFFLNCSSEEGRARKLLETARFEEQQNNKSRAQKLYNEILEQYPDTEAAQELRDQKQKEPEAPGFLQ